MATRLSQRVLCIATTALLLTLLVTAANFTNSSCTNIRAPTVPGATVLSISGVEVHNYTSPPLPPFFLDTVSGLNVCNVSVFLTHPGVNDNVLVQLFLPLTAWNGRFQATGGGGWATSFGEVQLSRAAAGNYAASRTDGGHPDNFYDPSSWALGPDGKPNIGLLTNYASRSLHDMAIVGKAVIQSFYGKEAAYSYWSGCSTGGREGLAEAQLFPDDFDGILAAAPTINWPSTITADEWPQVVMNNEGYFPSQCEYNAFIGAAVKTCDALDGVTDGVIGNLDACNFDPGVLVGTSVPCPGGEIKITSQTAKIVQMILDGPKSARGQRLWYGLNPGTDFLITANTTISPTTGKPIGLPFQVPDAWIKLFLKADPTYDTASITYEQFRQLFRQAKSQYDAIIGINNPNLSAFKASGGKMITWQGLADDIVFSEGIASYYQQVQKATPGKRSGTQDFYRLFLAPGAGHCYPLAGPVPTDAFGPLVNWVEEGVAPDTLAAAGAPSAGGPPLGPSVSRILCPWPQVARYDGKGDTADAKSYKCAKSFK